MLSILLKCLGYSAPNIYILYCIFLKFDKYAGIAQSVEQLICNQQVGGSSPSTSSNISYEVEHYNNGLYLVFLHGGYYEMPFNY